MSRNYATQCPECETRFQVTLEQMNKAQGLVRCGTCLHVFAADQYLETSSETEPNPVLEQKPDKESSYIPEVPLQLQLTEKPDSTRSYIGWCFMILLAFSTLGFQVLWFERDQLSQYPQLEPLYSKACMHLECKLSARQDLPRIISHHLIIRDHPKYLGALSVDLLIENKAPFEQPFPALQLVFSTLSGEPKAARTFQPGEYLGGDFENIQLMPTGKQVRLNLEILEPSLQAPNYTLSFLPAKKRL